MSTAAVRTSNPVAVLRQIDLIVLAMALPVFALADLSLVGYATGAGAWLVQRGVKALLDRRAAASEDARAVAGVMVASMLLRPWLVAIAILAVGRGDRAAGLAAAVLVVVLFTVYFTMSLVLRPLAGGRRSKR